MPIPDSLANRFRPDFTSTLGLLLSLVLSPVLSGAQTRISYVSQVDGNAEIYSIKPNGSDAIRLTHHPALDMQPAWSPDGTRLAFVSERDGRRDIWLMQADGGGLRRLTEVEVDGHPVEFTHPAWLRGNSLVFQSEPGGHSLFSDIWRLDLDGGRPDFLRLGGGNGDATHPIANPGGGIVFLRIAMPGLLREFPTALGFFRFSDTSGTAIIERNPRNIAYAHRSERLAYDEEGDVWVGNQYGIEAKNLTAGQGGRNPTWSPDETELAYEADGAVWIMSDTGVDKRRLVAGSDPAWSPALPAASAVLQKTWGQVKTGAARPP